MALFRCSFFFFCISLYIIVIRSAYVISIFSFPPIVYIYISAIAYSSRPPLFLLWSFFWPRIDSICFYIRIYVWNNTNDLVIICIVYYLEGCVLDLYLVGTWKYFGKQSDLLSGCLCSFGNLYLWNILPWCLPLGWRSGYFDFELLIYIPRWSRAFQYYLFAKWVPSFSFFLLYICFALFCWQNRAPGEC